MSVTRILMYFLIRNVTGRLRIWSSFPVEVSRADYALLLRVPGIGPKSAQRIVKARRQGRLDYTSLKRMGVVLKRGCLFYHL